MYYLRSRVMREIREQSTQDTLIKNFIRFVIFWSLRLVSWLAAVDYVYTSSR